MKDCGKAVTPYLSTGIVRSNSFQQIKLSIVILGESFTRLKSLLIAEVPTAVQFDFTLRRR